MGYMTTVTFLNDLWHVIEKNPEEFVDIIDKGMDGIAYLQSKPNNLEVNSYGIENRTNGISIAKSHHADEPRLYFVHHNAMTSLGTSDNNVDIKIRKQRLSVARQLIRLEADKIKELERKVDNE